jgi:N6-L-threonylcarbamoyladenine synthase
MGKPGKLVREPSFPNVTLVVSGGHTSLFKVEVVPKFSYTRLGQTRDDAAGEAFDKVAKLLSLGYPGGPVIDRLASFGDPRAVDFGRVRMKGNQLDFSFSGLKTAVLYRVRGTALAAEAEDRAAWVRNKKQEPRNKEQEASPFVCHSERSEESLQATPTSQKETDMLTDNLRAHCSQETLDLIASFQHAVVTDLVERTLAAADREGVECIFVSGGVACNSLLRERFSQAAGRARQQVFFPSPSLSTDNAAMIAAAGFYKLAAGERADARLTAHASLPLG